MAGFVATVLDDSHLRVNQLMIHPDFQGRGVGASVLKEILGRAEDLQRPVRLQCMRENSRALAFYKRHGFVEIGGDDASAARIEPTPAQVASIFWRNSTVPAAVS